MVTAQSDCVKGEVSEMAPYEKAPWELAPVMVRVPRAAGVTGEKRRQWEIGYFGGESPETWTVLATTNDLEYARYIVGLHRDQLRAAGAGSE